MLDLISERKGIYLFILPDLKVGYVGSSNNIKKRYFQHTEGKGGNKLIKDQIDRGNKVEFMILEYCDGFTTKDLKLIESNWIKHFRANGLNLINVSEPTTEPIYKESKAVLVYNAENLEFVGEYASQWEASKNLKISQSHISKAILERKSKKGDTRYTVSNYFFFLKEEFTQNSLKEKQRRFLKARSLRKENRKKNGMFMGKFTAKKINQFTKSGKFIKTWDSIREVERDKNINNGSISNCLKNKRKTAGGYIWRYAESEETNDNPK